MYGNHAKYPGKKINSKGVDPFVALCFLLCALIVSGTIQYRESEDAERAKRGVVVEVAGESQLVYGCDVCHRGMK